MRIRLKPVVSAAVPGQAQASGRHRHHVRKHPDSFIQKDPAWHQHMENNLRADQHAGTRPASRMTSGGKVYGFEDAATKTLATGVIAHALLDDVADPSLRIERVDVEAGSATPESRAPHDQRTLVHGSGTLVLNGVRQGVAHGDMVLLPKGTKFSFEAAEMMKLWSVATPADSGAMKRSAGVLSEDPKKEFFVGEGVQVLERANDAADPAVGFDRIRAPLGVTTALHKLKIDERYLVTHGEGDVEVDGKTSHVKAGDVVSFRREETQRITPTGAAMEFYSVTTPRFLVDDFEPVADGMVDPAKYDGSAGDLAFVQSKLKSS